MTDANMVDEAGRYAPAGSYVDYEGIVIRRFLERRLPDWRASHQKGGPEAKIASAEAFGTRLVLNDYVDEGYGEFLAWAFKEAGPSAQLDAFLEQTGESQPTLLGDLTDLGRVDLDWKPGDRQPLPDFLQFWLEVEQPPDISVHFPSAEETDTWKARTEILMGEMVKYIRWVYERVEQHGWQPVSLLRDAMLIHFGLIWLGREDAKSLLLNRKFMDAFGAREEVYVKLLVETLYRDLAGPNPPTDFAEIRRRFTDRAMHPDLIPPKFVDACRVHLSELHLDAAPCWVESGVNATFPLWLFAINGNEGGMALYNTVPWLYDYYEASTFRRDYQLLREMETIVAHESLFQIELVDPSATPMHVVVTEDQKARDLAAFEVATLRRLLR